MHTIENQDMNQNHKCTINKCMYEIEIINTMGQKII